MLFNSYVFVSCFLPIVLLGFFVCAHIHQRLATGWLVIASLTFYGWWNAAFLPLLLASMLMNYGVSEAIGRAALRPRLQAAILWLAVAMNLSALLYYKYLYAISQSFVQIGVLDTPMDPVILPLGISFFTFTQIGYLIDVKEGAAKDRGFLNYALFVTFFPHLIAGPILHNREMMPQFAQASTYRFSATNVSVGATVFIIGFFKKTILADPLSDMVASGFNHPGALPMVDAWRTIMTYSLQLYFDFSGYSDMAIGLARMFNIRFPLNFDSPFKSQTVIEYWQRWHMTLTRYLNLYLYNPIALAVVRWRAKRGLGTTRAAHRTFGGFVSMIALPTFMTMTLIGLWHGAGLQFLIFGLLHAVYITVNNALRVFRPTPRGRVTPWWQQHVARVCNVLLTYVAVLVGLVFFRSLSLADAWGMLGGMMGLHGLGSAAPLGVAMSLWLVVLYAIVWGAPNVQQIMGKFEPAIGKTQPGRVPEWLLWRGTLRWAVAAGLMLTLAVLGMGGTSEFLYFQF